jgi:3-oxoacyl-[acyl-carrier protein] reductase
LLLMNGMMGKLQNKIALITGGTRGIGKSIAVAFVREGARLFITGHVDHQALDDGLGELRSAGAQAEGGLFDIGSYDEVRRLADEIANRFGSLDIVVNNAGNLSPTPLLEITSEAWERTIRTHLNGTFYCTMEMVRRFLKPQRHGKIINVTAPSAVRGSYGVADYASAKAGIVAFTRNAARELLPLNIQVNAVLPVAQTRMTDALASYYAGLSNAETVARLATLAPPEAVAPAFVFFASADSDYITGQVLAADGGLLA